MCRIHFITSKWIPTYKMLAHCWVTVSWSSDYLLTRGWPEQVNPPSTWIYRQVPLVVVSWSWQIEKKKKKILAQSDLRCKGPRSSQVGNGPSGAWLGCCLFFSDSCGLALFSINFFPRAAFPGHKMMFIKCCSKFRLHICSLHCIEERMNNFVPESPEKVVLIGHIGFA